MRVGCVSGAEQRIPQQQDQHLRVDAGGQHPFINTSPPKSAWKVTSSGTSGTSDNKV
ncbi:MAG: hypothetical protein H0W78_00810 [Planctomycetes bacterium]|nr:hypothetical protein [Planctomycetota bacterium]